jgi:hypothetical protein
LEDRLSVHQLGLGDEAGQLRLHLTGTGSSFDNAFNDNAVLPTILVPVDTLDNQVEKLELSQVDFIKIDVEGFEQKVLAGAAQTIERYRPILFIEIADHIRGRQYQNPEYATTLRWLRARGYEIWRCTEDKRLVPANPDESQAHLAMYLCLPHQAYARWLPKLQPWVRQYHARKRKEKINRVFRKVLLGIRHPKLVVRKVMIMASRRGY